jgi:predicted AAA+ superfamily ATPase
MLIPKYFKFIYHATQINVNLWTKVTKIMVVRKLEQSLLTDLKPGHVTALFGARRTGKTILMSQLKALLPQGKILQLNGEEYDAASLLSSRKQSVLNNLVGGYDYLFVDEAQSIPQIGENLKLLVDTNPGVAVFVTGSSAFDLKSNIGEPLTGRSRFWYLYPFSLQEIATDYLSSVRMMPSLLVYGMYPQVFLAQNNIEKRVLLESIRNGYLLKDVLQLDNLKDSLFVMNLLRNLAFQIGNDVSYNELARSLNTTVKTVQRYLEILEKSYIIFRMNGFSRNLRKEISKSPRFYFWDNGIRNAVISQFDQLETRNDIGKLWENFCISERIKKQSNSQSFSNFFFWRTYDQQEIDLIEENGNLIKAFEFKWNDKLAKAPGIFMEHYPNAVFETINPKNVFDFLVK